MSLVNRHPIVQKIINSYNKCPNIDDKKWTLIFLKTKFDNWDINLEKYFYEQVYNSICHQILIEEIYIYSYNHPENNNRFEYLIKNFNAKLIDISLLIKTNSLKLFIVDTFMGIKRDIILLEDEFGYIDTNPRNTANLPIINSIENIYSNFEPVDKMVEPANLFSQILDQPLQELFAPSKVELNGAYLGIAEKFNINEIILSNILIVPFTNNNQLLINHALLMANQLIYTDMNLMTNIALTITNAKFKYCIKNINRIDPLNFICFDNMKNIHYLTEKFIIDQNHQPITFDDPEYIYYPYLDVDPVYYIGQKNDTDRSIMNTNGFSPTIPTDVSINELYYRRFNDKSSGIFVKKMNKACIIPKIIHHLWLDSVPITNYTNLWGRINREPWQYIIWTEAKLKNDVLKGRWLTYYENNSENKILIASLAILEKYGGIVIDSFVIPIKLFPDDFLTNIFAISFMNELNIDNENVNDRYGPKLSYRIIASVPGTPNANKRHFIRADAARRPFEGANNFFIDIKMRNREKLLKMAIDDQDDNDLKIPVTNPVIFEHFCTIFSSNEIDKMSIIEKFLLTDTNITIYPSYYFNPNCYAYPKKLIEQAICINLWRAIVPERRIKTNIVRTYNISESSILASLNENPRDRLKNNNTI